MRVSDQAYTVEAVRAGYGSFHRPVFGCVRDACVIACSSSGCSSGAASLPTKICSSYASSKPC